MPSGPGMTDSGIGVSTGCRCSCQTDLASSEFDLEGSEPRSSCCSPQIFTSVLLGILACVLVVGGVFLSFHRWDPLWLIVSGVGILLIFIGSILHCSGSQSESRTRSASGTTKGCRTLAPDHHHPNHQIAHNGSLTEQLLPLSNARSVSQLSLNMLPGYFPPVVSTYGIEQHSAVVQNINRIIQQQQLQHQSQQPPQQQSQQQVPTGSISPSVYNASNAGKNFILLSLPADTNPANIQNLLSTVYQLDGSVSTENTAVDVARLTSESPTLVIPSPVLPIFKNAEVQTCNSWTAGSTLETNDELTITTTASTSNNCHSDSVRTVANNSVSTASIVTQTEDVIGAAIPINLMDCGSDLPPVCDNIQNASDSSDFTNGVLLSIPDRQSNFLVEVFEPCATVVNVPRPDLPQSEGILTSIQSNSASLVDISDPSSNECCYDLPSSILVDTSLSSCEVLVVIPGMCSDALIGDAGPSSNALGNAGPSSNALGGNAGPSSNAIVGNAGPSSNAFSCSSGPSSNALGDSSGPSSNALGDSSGPSSNALGGSAGPSSNAIAGQSASSNILVGESGSSSALVDQSDSSSSANHTESISNELIDTTELSNFGSSEFPPAIQGPSTSRVNVPMPIPGMSVCVPKEQNGREGLLNGREVIPINVILPEIQFACNITSDESGIGVGENCVPEMQSDRSLATLDCLRSRLSSSGSGNDLSVTDDETDDGDSVGRSSPPPSYEDATNENGDEATIGAFGLGYGTI